MFFLSLFFSPLFASFLGILLHVFNSSWIRILADLELGAGSGPRGGKEGERR